MGDRSYLSIGDVLALLREEFPDITISKIRFLESRGLLVPERTPSGYRKFYDHDVERLRWILRQQREHFLPLKVIKGRLEGAESASQPESLFDPGEAPPAALVKSGLRTLAAVPSQNGNAHPSVAAFSTERPSASLATVAHTASRHEDERAEGSAVSSRAPAPEPSPARVVESARPTPAATFSPATGGSARQPDGARAPDKPVEKASPATASPRRRSALLGDGLTAGEIAQSSGLSVSEVEELESYGLIEGRTVAGVHCFEEDALQVARAAAGFAAFGIGARHLRIFKHAAERQAGLYSQVVMPLLRQRNPEARKRANDDLEKMAELGREIQACFMAGWLEGLTGR